MNSKEQVIAETRAWVDRAVIGLNLCPFAKAPQVKGQIRYAMSLASDPAALAVPHVARALLLSLLPTGARRAVRP